MLLNSQITQAPQTVATPVAGFRVKRLCFVIAGLVLLNACSNIEPLEDDSPIASDEPTLRSVSSRDSATRVS